MTVKCDKCGKSFPKQGALENHMKDKHKIIPEHVQAKRRVSPPPVRKPSWLARLFGARA